MKRLVLCSDGTGNAGNKLNGTNVWRLYEAVRRLPAGGDPADSTQGEQRVFYDDGVGTEEFKFLKLAAGATGYGLERNVTSLYAHILRNYDPGDEIYLFGFSRGAFTVRVIANLLYYCGIARPRENGQSLPQDQVGDEAIARLARQAVAAYKKRKVWNPSDGLPEKFRRDYGLIDSSNVAGEPGWFPLHFVGVWDTVEAYGLPIDELADAYFKLFPLRLKQQGEVIENDLHPLICHARHALSIDDERHTFHPKLWIENTPFDWVGDCQERPIPRADGCRAFGARLDETKQQVLRTLQASQTVVQTWFPGMHADVGGGYPQDKLAHVSLNWMIDHAARCGLVFDDVLRQSYLQEADPLGKMHDSRSGVGVIYRYRPRDLATLCATAGIRKPTIHSSVLCRIGTRTDNYAPTGIPKDYDIDPTAVAPIPRQEQNPDERMRLQKYGDDAIWYSRVQYGMMILWGMIAIFLASHYSGQEPMEADVAAWGRLQYGFYVVYRPLLDLAAWVVPDYLDPGLAALAKHPPAVFGLLVSFVVIWVVRGRLVAKVRRRFGDAWLATLKGPPGKSSTPAQPPRWRPAAIRENLRTDLFANWFYRFIVPKLVFVSSLLLLAFLLWRWLAPMFFHNPQPDLARPPFHTGDVQEFTFDSRVPYFSTQAWVQQGGWYQIQVQEIPVEGDPEKPWRDATIPANAEGFIDPPHVALRLAGLSRRNPKEPWFKLLGAIGPEFDDTISIGQGCVFEARRSGRLYLFVNDALGAYHNNRGTAKVKVTALQVPGRLPRGK
ncbi:MAG: DUF2235 domain-containing protein [Planctomycetales bacterium]